jgi:hypothetical protein
MKLTPEEARAIVDALERGQDAEDLTNHINNQETKPLISEGLLVRLRARADPSKIGGEPSTPE